MFRILIAAFLLLALTLPARADFDYTNYARLLQSYVKTGVVIDGIRTNAVDYARIARDSADIKTPYPRLIDALATFNPDTLATREEKLAFWINAYNIGAIKMIVEHYPVDSIRSMKISILTYPWKKDILNVGGKNISLDRIEHLMLLEKLGEPRIHFAIVCASLSCPDLKTTPYTAKDIDKELDDAARAYINNETKGVRIDRQNKVLYLSSIFDWYEDDFKGIGGVPAVLQKYLAKPEDREFLTGGTNWLNFMTYDWKQMARSKYAVEYLDYNWKLNDTRFAGQR